MKSRSVYSKVTKTAFGLYFAKAHISSFLLKQWTKKLDLCIVQTGVHYNLTSSKKRSCISSIDKWPSDNQPNSRQHLTKGQKLQEKEAQHTVSAAIKIVGSSTLSWLPVVWSLDIMALAWRTIHNQNQKTNDLNTPFH